MSAPWWAWAGTVAVVLALITLDFAAAARRPHAVGLREATAWSIAYIALAIGFGIVLAVTDDGHRAAAYLTGWLVEKSLSVDNLFVFLIIMRQFAVPPQYQQKVLLVGITAALVMRAALIAVGAAAISLFSPTFLLFGLLLIFTAVRLARHFREDPDVENNRLVRATRRVLPTSEKLHGGRMLAREDGRRVVTPLFVVFLAIGGTDFIFALDSIPAVFGVTQDPFLVFAANAFALLGLRALYFLIEGLLSRLVYLSLGLAVILAFIGVKLILFFGHENVSSAVPTVATPVSLVVILVVLAVSTVTSLYRVRRHPEERAHAGTLRRRPPAEPRRQLDEDR
ncbi:TerC family protein [Phytohabitans flavus]|uniref:Tellurium resistance protein TerC n=1 Tax=Phytohabitans flavus TaxID=1076124 RepID=A0A6F8XMR6_9ACTN|nr:TerC/Alx family metal homeostasis membrane protein [Phytohabitans flavus]BCB75078.1 tellurium resistance protein TerC [Phytohabitans flavus]